MRYYGGDNTKELRGCISIVVPLKTEWLGKKKQKKHEGYYRDLFAYVRVHLR